MTTDIFLDEYTSHEAITKYTRATAGFGISYLLDHDYKEVYLRALQHLPESVKSRGIRMLEFGCGGGMNLLHLISVLQGEKIRVQNAIGTDFSPVLIDAAKREAKHYLSNGSQCGVQFHVAKNQSLVQDLAKSLGKDEASLRGSLDFILGVNTIRYCHEADQEVECARGIFELLAPGGVCVNIDMNNRYPLFRSDLKNRLRRHKEEECYVPSLEEYTSPFQKAGFKVLRSEHFCWVPHSSGQAVCRIFSTLTPLLNLFARSRAMRSLVVAQKPE